MIESSRIRLLKPNTRVWLVNAGKDRKFLEEFVRSRSIFLETPAFSGVEGIFDDDDILRTHLSRSWFINEHLRGALANAPSRNLNQYDAYPFAAGTPDARAFGEIVGNVVRLFSKAKVGDLVLVPRYGSFAPFLVGEITKPWSVDDSREIPQLQNEIAAVRKVRWLQTAVARSDFVPKVGRRLVNRHAVTKVPREFYQAIFGKVYPNYVWGEISKLDIFGDGYSGKDPTQPYLAAKLVKFVLASVFAYEKGEIEEFNALSRRSQDAAVERYYDEGLVLELAQNFNSPGRFTVIGALGSLSLLASAALLLATSEDGGNFGAQKTAVEQRMNNDVSGSAAQKEQAVQEIRNFLNSADGQVWEPVQRDIGRPAASSLDLSLSNRVELERKRAEFDQ